MIPLEVQVTRQDRTVRVSPTDFYEAVNDGRARGYFGIFDLETRPVELTGRPLTVTLFVYDSTTGANTLHETLGPGVARRTWLTFDYYPRAGGAFGVITPGGTESDELTPGRWVQFTTAFANLVDDALETGPAVAPVSAPPSRHTSLNDEDPIFDPLVLPALGIALGLLVVFLAMMASRKARERHEAGRERLSSATKDHVLSR